MNGESVPGRQAEEERAEPRHRAPAGPRRRVPTWLRVLLVFVLFAVLAVTFTRPLAVHNGGETVKHELGDPELQAWTLAWDAHEVLRNPLNLFNANILYPNRYTLAYTDDQITNGVLAIPILAVSDNPIQAHNLLLIFSFFLCAVGAFLLARHLTGSIFAGTVAGIAYAFAPYKLAHFMHLNLLTAGFIPLTFLFLHRYCEERRPYDAALAALFFLLQTLTTWHYGLMLSFAILLFMLVRLIMNRRTFTLRWLAWLVVSFVVALLIIFPFARPYFALTSQPGFERSTELIEQYEADVSDFLVAPSTNQFWGEITRPLREQNQQPAFRATETERSLFPGLLALFFGVVGAVYLFRKGKGEKWFTAWFYVVLAVVSAVLCLGVSLYVFGHKLNIPMPYKLLYYVYPGFKGMRVPNRFAIMIALALAVLAAWGVKVTADWVSARWDRRAGMAVMVLIVLLLLVDVASAPLPMQKIPAKSQFASVYQWLKDQPGDTPTVELPIQPVPERIGQFVRQESMRDYYSTLHWKKIMNGHSGFLPVSLDRAMNLYRTWPSQAAVDYFKHEKLQYVIVHGAQMSAARLAKTLQWSKDHFDFSLVTRQGDDYVFQLK